MDEDELEDLIFRLRNEIDSERYVGGDVSYIHQLELELEGAQDAYHQAKLDARRDSPEQN